MLLQATEYIFKYIIQSRRLFALATGGQSEDEFRCCMRELFMSLRFFLSQDGKAASPVTQTQVGPHLLCIPPALRLVLNQPESALHCLQRNNVSSECMNVAGGDIWISWLHSHHADLCEFCRWGGGCLFTHSFGEGVQAVLLHTQTTPWHLSHRLCLLLWLPTVISVQGRQNPTHLRGHCCPHVIHPSEGPNIHTVY